MSEAQQRLAKKVKDKAAPRPDLRLRRATVVNVGSTSATVHLGGSDVPSVPFYIHVTGLAAGQLVDVVMDGESPVIIGRLT